MCICGSGTEDLRVETIDETGAVRGFLGLTCGCAPQPALSSAPEFRLLPFPSPSAGRVQGTAPHPPDHSGGNWCREEAPGVPSDPPEARLSACDGSARPANWNKVQDRMEVTCGSAPCPSPPVLCWVHVCRGDVGYRLSLCLPLEGKRPSVLQLLITHLKQNTQPQNDHTARLTFQGLLRLL